MQQSAKGQVAENWTGDRGTSLVCFSGLLDLFMEGGIGAPCRALAGLI